MNIKQIIGATVIVGAVALGDYTRPVSKIADMVKYYQVPIAKHSPKDPWNYKLEERIVNDHRQLYLVNVKTDEYKRINEDACTCGLDNVLYQLEEKAESKWSEVKDYVGDVWNNLFE